MAEKKKYSTFAVMFYINKGKVKKSGMTTIMGRISVSGEMTQFSTKIDVDPAQWDTKRYRLKGKGREVLEINNKLDNLTNEITLHHRELVDRQSYVTAELLKNKVCNIGQKQETLLTLYAEHNADYEKMIGVNRAAKSAVSYHYGYKYTREFIEEILGVDDIPLSQLNLSFIEQFDLFLRGRKGYAKSTVNGHMVSLRRVVKRGLNQGVIRKDPFVGYTFEAKPHRYRHMSAADLERMLSTPIKSKAVCFARDMFIFSTFTGISFADMRNLSTKHLHQDGARMWIEIKRQKTKSECYIPLLDIPRKIIAKYETVRRSDKVFNMVTSATMQENLEKVVKLCGIEAHVSYHDSRHNFGTLITLLNGVPLETVSKMMGHNDLKTTEIYAHLTSQKIAEDMKLIAKKTKRKYKLFEDNSVPVVEKYNYFEYKQRYEKRYNNN
ncbi:MAG: site-specific integrase [Rikenellaceae bacterium]